MTFQGVDVYWNEPIKIDELVKLANQSIQWRTRYRSGKDKNNYHFWKQKLSWCEKLLKWILQNISENQTFQRTEKFNMANFYETDFIKGIFVKLVKVDERTLEKSASPSLLVER